MKLFLFPFFFLVFTNSCKTKTVDPDIDTFDIYASKSDKVIIRYHSIQNSKETRASKTITSISEIKRLRELIQESKKSESCYKPTGMISFYKDNEEFVSLEFGLAPECPSIYIYFEGKPMTYKISYQFGMFLEYTPRTEVK